MAICKPINLDPIECNKDGKQITAIDCECSEHLECHPSFNCYWPARAI